MNTAEHVRALTAGAVAVVPRHALPATVREVFEAALHSRCILPVDVLRALAAASPSTTLQPDIVPSPQELEWLRQMADGRTVARLAASVGYSDRMMFRLLRNLYDRLNVKGRTDALVLARTMGWI
jgi:DNA-binding NarL/FixJ family response regulator